MGGMPANQGFVHAVSFQVFPVRYAQAAPPLGKDLRQGRQGYAQGACFRNFHRHQRRRRSPGRQTAVGRQSLQEVKAFGSNPGRLRMLRYVPADLPKKSPLVVVLHGCHQTAEAYDHGSGWSTLARERGFAVVYAEQKRSNNGNLCFNWFRPSNVTRDRGEVMSIRQMVAKMASAHGIDRKRVFVTGLSAGGAMAAAMLAAYPDVFRGGGIIAGLPYGAARDVHRALAAMKKAPERTAAGMGRSRAISIAGKAGFPGSLHLARHARTIRSRCPTQMRCCSSGLMCMDLKIEAYTRKYGRWPYPPRLERRHGQDRGRVLPDRGHGPWNAAEAEAGFANQRRIRPAPICSMPGFLRPCIWQPPGV